MGRFKGEGICWSGECTAPATKRVGAYQDGTPCLLCEPCAQRTRAAFLKRAEQIVASMDAEISAKMDALKAELSALEDEMAVFLPLSRKH